MSLLLFRTSSAKESAIYHHLTNTQFIAGGFALILIIIFALAAFLDYGWNKAASLREFSAEDKPNSFLHSQGPATKMGRAVSTHHLQT